MLQETPKCLSQGEQIYRAALPITDLLMLTEVDQEPAGEAFFQKSTILTGSKPFAIHATATHSSVMNVHDRRTRGPTTCRCDHAPDTPRPPQEVPGTGDISRKISHASVTHVEPSVRSLASVIKNGSVSAREVVQATLEASDRMNRIVHFMAEWNDHAALAAADRIDATPPARRGRLAGVPFVQKTSLDQPGPLVDRLTAAGAISIGRSTKPGPGTSSQLWGTDGTHHTLNPWNLDYGPGGSSAGAAVAVATRVVPFATGGDSAGSLRIPAAFCGVVGYKPSHGLVPRALPRQRIPLTTAGLITASVDDIGYLTALATERDPNDPFRGSALQAYEGRAPEVAYSANLGYADTDPDVDALVRKRVERLADDGVIELIDINIDLPDPEHTWTVLNGHNNGRTPSIDALDAAFATRDEIDDRLADVFNRADAVVTPTTPHTAFRYDAYEETFGTCQLTWAFNISGHPAITVPAGLIDGLPVGLQIIARPRGDSLALHIADQAHRSLPETPIICRPNLFQHRNTES